MKTKSIQKKIKSVDKKLKIKSESKSRAKKKKRRIRLGVNLDHVATLRQVRGGTTAYPNLVEFVKQTIKAGAQQITIHLREDRRHIQDQDLKDVSKACSVLLNLEMAATDEMVAIARREKPDWACVVPEKREELTTEGGLDVAGFEERMKRIVHALTRDKIKVSMFIEPSLTQVEASARVGANAVEFHTGHWVALKGVARQQEWTRLVTAAERAHTLGLNVHAGHGLDFDSTREICALPYLQEVNIGHFLICDALHKGLTHSIKKMKKILKKGTR